MGAMFVRGLIVLLLAGAAASLLFLRANQPAPNPQSIPTVALVNTNALETPSSGPSPLMTEATPAPSEAPPPLNDTNDQANSYVGRVDLIVPVYGVKPSDLRDTFSDARSEGRVHDAIDIPAPAGTPVLAAGDGQIVKLFLSERGGTTIYQTSQDRKLIFYYAHLSQYAEGITEGKIVHKGEVIAYVGDTGNAGAGNYHLHFSISVVSDPQRYWEGTNINPYPILHR